MTIVPSLGSFVAPYKPLNNITPFTYRDGATYLEVLEDLRFYVNNTLVAFVNTNFGMLGDAFETQVNLMIDNVESQLAAQSATVNDQLADETTFVNQSIADLTAYVDLAVETITNSSIEVAGTVVLALINNPTSDVRVALNGLYAAKSDVATLQTLVASGRLSQTALDNAYVAAAIITGAGRLSQASLDAAYLASTLASGSGRLSQSSLDAAYAAKTIETIVSTGRLSASSLPLSLSGTYAARPAANSVPVNSIYYCTNVPEMYVTNGTVWTVIGSGGNELASATIAAGPGFTFTSTALIDVTGLTVSFTVGERPIEIRFFADYSNSVANAVTDSFMILDGTQIGQAGLNPPYAGVTQSIYSNARKTGLTPGTTHTAKIQAAVSSGTGKFGSAFNASFMQVVTL